ncbi:pre-mRNA-processing factor 19-like isoform X2 [Apium graveolens]|uniref:pre-mRNA-processing factor 19-like isoform X2 n=1 Tax=Apium graveolens TaxID=4045 RepID=UPI003D795B15
MMKCSVSGRVPNYPVISKISGHMFDKEVIEKHIRDYGKCPITGASLTMDDIIGIFTKEVLNSNYAAEVLNESSSSSNSTRTSTAATGESACPQLPSSIAKEIKITRRKLSECRIHRDRKMSPSLATVDALRGYIFHDNYTLHKNIKPGVLCMDIDNSKGIVATGGADTNAAVFDLLSRKTVSTLIGHSEKVTSVKFVKEGELVVTGSGDNTVRVWQRSEEEEGSYKCKDIVDHHAEVRAVTIHPSQKYFVTSFDCTWKLYDLASESHVAQVACHKGSESFSTALFHPDGRVLGTCASGLVRFWDVAKQGDILKIDAHTDRVTSIAFSENGYNFATAAGDGVKLWDLRFLRSIKTFPLNDISQTRSVDFDHSGKYLATGGSGISIYEIAETNPITTLSLPRMSDKGDLSCLKFGKDAKYIAAAGTLDSDLLLFGSFEGNDS